MVPFGMRARAAAAAVASSTLASFARAVGTSFLLVGLRVHADGCQHECCDECDECDGPRHRTSLAIRRHISMNGLRETSHVISRMLSATT